MQIFNSVSEKHSFYGSFSTLNDPHMETYSFS